MKRKHTLAFIVLLLIVVNIEIIAQPNTGFYYQAALHDTELHPIAGEEVSLRVNLHRGTINGTIDYSETHTVETSPLGIVNLLISEGDNVSGNFEDIQWGQYTYYIELELDRDNTGDYTSVGTTQVMTVPLAAYALEAGNVNNSDVDPENELQTLIYENDSLKLSSVPGGVVLDSDVWKYNDTIVYIVDKPISIGMDENYGYPGNGGTMLTIRNINDETITNGIHTGIQTSLRANIMSNVNAESSAKIGYIGTGPFVYGVEGRVNNVSYLGNLHFNENGNSRCIGGNFNVSLNNLSYVHPYGTYIVAGTYGGVSGTVSDYPHKTIISGVYGVDNVQTDSTYAAYFDGRVYVRDSLSVGIKNPQRPLHIKDVMRLEPRATEPPDPQEGDIYYDETTHTLRVYRGAANGGWVDCF